MNDLKISLITIVYNAETTISRCIESVISQNYKNVEYIIIDGGSADQTVSVIEKYQPYLTHYVAEPDSGIYDAMNKGIRLATGQVVGMLNADDYFAENNVLSTIANMFGQTGVDAVYGDLDYIDKRGGILRQWRSGEFNRRNFERGWMPPHPTFYCKRLLFEKFGLYSLRYGTAADYELMLRFLYANKLQAAYIQKVLVKMSTGGHSNRTLRSRFNGSCNDYRAMRDNHILFPLLTLLMKPVRKIVQYF